MLPERSVRLGLLERGSNYQWQFHSPTVAIESCGSNYDH